MIPKRDTIITVKRRVNPDSIKYMICDEIYTAKGDTMLYVRDIPSGMKYTAERARDVEVTVKWDAPVGGSPVGYMVFGDTAKYTAKSTLVLDGQWEPIVEPQLKSDKIVPSDYVFAPVTRPSIVIHDRESTGAGFNYNAAVDVANLFMWIGFAIYAALSLPGRLKD